MITASLTLPMSGSDKLFAGDLLAQRGEELQNFESLGGGSINRVYLLTLSSGKQVLKINDAEKYPGMFAAERAGLQELSKAAALDVPEVLGEGESQEHSWLLLEYKKATEPDPEFWTSLAEGLAKLHKKSSVSFGFSSPNYIGSLPQMNESRQTAADFYISQRLQPQLEIAADQGFKFKDEEIFLKNIAGTIPSEPPALVHGDLWNGNYIINEKGFPCLIDPAVCYAPREMDLAMMKLFGGFPQEVFSEYNACFPLSPGFTSRIRVWQLYYLLVHLNIFGSSYFASVNRIIRNFS